MNVKVKRTALIASLSKAAKVREDAIAKRDKEQKAWRKQVDDRLEAIKAAVVSGKLKISEAYVGHRNDVATLTVQLTGALAKETPFPASTTPIYSDHEVDEIKSAIALLNLSDEDYVNAATYKNVAKYLA